MATDPVCFAHVDEDDAPFRTKYDDREYYFCTGYCKKQFLKEPKKYSRRNADISIEPGGASC
jgi:YHS domain-containing protein